MRDGYELETKGVDFLVDKKVRANLLLHEWAEPYLHANQSYDAPKQPHRQEAGCYKKSSLRVFPVVLQFRLQLENLIVLFSFSHDLSLVPKVLTSTEPSLLL